MILLTCNLVVLIRDSQCLDGLYTERAPASDRSTPSEDRHSASTSALAFIQAQILSPDLVSLPGRKQSFMEDLDLNQSSADYWLSAVSVVRPTRHFQIDRPVLELTNLIHPQPRFTLCRISTRRNRHPENVLMRLSISACINSRRLGLDSSDAAIQAILSLKFYLLNYVHNILPL